MSKSERVVASHTDPHYRWKRSVDSRGEIEQRNTQKIADENKNEHRK